MRAIAAVLGLLLALVASAAAQRLTPTDVRLVEDFIDTPHVLFGRTRASVERALGAPSSVRTLGRPGGDGEALDELTYPGLRLDVSARTTTVRRLEITEPRWTLPRGLNVGTPRSVIETILGEAQRVSDGSAFYTYADGFPNTVEFYFREGRVQRIEWRYAPAD
ncbi:MAG TPA: hypothetical protein VHT71_18355 [Methylomirabilota bacterium]|jgi:hypothetical protein|nr:hypothetical protein [Methylomirabilota bacterium]